MIAVNKLDLVDYSHEVFDDIVAEYTSFANEIGLGGVVAIPMSAYVVTTSPNAAPTHPGIRGRR